MQVNVTFVFQIANFLVSMYFIRKFFYDPLLDGLIKKKLLIKTMTHSCDYEKEKIRQLETASEEVFSSFQENALKAYPKQKKDVLFDVPIITEKTSSAKAPSEAEIAAVAQILQEKIRHEFIP